jgi:bifunctional oligoribonuclease and PAP phosphatase NrnA
MAIDWTPFVTSVRTHQRFLLTTHVRPDPDGLGSMLGLAEILQGMGKKARMIVSGTYPPRYAFLDREERIERFQPNGDYREVETVIVLDTGTWNQLGDFGAFLKVSPVPRLVIDHHVSQDDLGATRLVDTNAEATGRLVYEAITALGRPLTRRAANMLFVALATDTGWFRHPNTKPATHALAATLMEAGAEPTALYDQVYEQNTLPRLKLHGLALERMQTAESGRVAHTEIHLADYPATGAIPSDTEDLVNYTRSIIGVEVGLLFVEQPAGGVKVSFRSRIVDVARIAEKFGGGGHRLASGATLQTPLTEAKARVLQAVHEALA